ncbi:MAG: repeat containing protein, partial [Verrucomicrobiales bacterium]|nr:repeat containing protein [Verrucomicrobiales bacterium]
AWWDGTDDLLRDPEAYKHGLYLIPPEFVTPGAYRVLGLYRKAIDLRYEFSLYTSGHPAWEVEDRTGAWLANHTAPSAVLFVPEEESNHSPAAPAPGGMILAGSYVSEGGHGLAWLDLDGRKRFGQMWIGGVWTGASHLARDEGKGGVAGVYAYAGAAFAGGGFDGVKAELRLAELVTREEKAATPRDGRFGQGWDRPLLVPNAPYSGILPKGPKKPEAGDADFRFAFPDNAHVGLSGLAVHDARLVATLPKMNQLLWVDAAKRKILGTVELNDPRGVAFDPQGRLLVLSGSRLLRFEVGPNPLAMSAPVMVVSGGLEDPQGITLDRDGTIYISDWGKSQQVKVFSSNGVLLRAIGHPGEPQAGLYDSSHMNHPKGLTIDSRNRLWVAEEDFQPKRVSVWTLDGQLVRAFYGPSEYGGGGKLDREDKNRFYYHGMEFRLDWNNGTDKLVRVFHRPAPGDLALPDGYGTSGMPEQPHYRNAQRYFSNDHNSNPTGGTSIAMVWLDTENVARPVAALGNARDWKILTREEFKPRWPAGVDLQVKSGKDATLFVWSDLNNDAQVQPDEVQMTNATEIGSITVAPDLSFIAARVGPSARRFRPEKFTSLGVPIFDLARGEVLANGTQGPASSGGGQALWHESGWTVLTTPPKPFSPYAVGAVFNGEPRWSYPSLWPGLHASHESPPPDRPGELIGTTRLLGDFITPGESDAGPLWCVNGNQGNMYLFTVDGLFVADLFKDVRRGTSWSMPVAERGMLLNGLTLHDENFWPSITQTRDGKVYLVDGGRSSLVRVDGLESVRRLPESTIQINSDDLLKARTYFVETEVLRQKSQGAGVMKVAIRDVFPRVDGTLDDWSAADWVEIDKSGVAAFFDSQTKPYNVSGSVAVAGGRLYAAFRTGDSNLLRNSGEMSHALFKTGGALDLMIGSYSDADENRNKPAAGDLRLLVAQVNGKSIAQLYRAVVPGTKEPVPFSSPWRTVTLDRVDEVTGQVELAGHDGNYELSIPLALLGLQPKPGQRIKADLGILRGNGFQTLQRVYWANKASGITADVPSEAELTPRLWGHWEFFGSTVK